MPMLTLRRLVWKLRRVVVREFLSAINTRVLDEDRVAFVLHQTILRLSAVGYTGVLLPPRRRSARQEPPQRGPPRRRAHATPVAPPSSTPPVVVPPVAPQTTNPYPPAFCPVHGYGPCVFRDAGVLETAIIAALDPSAPADHPSPTPAVEEERPRWRPPTPVPPGFGRRSSVAGPITEAPIAPPLSALPLPSPALLRPRRHAGEATARRPGLRPIKDEASSTGSPPNGSTGGGWLSSDEEGPDSVS